ncbi:substrate-binding periplasmic protein [Aeromonas schubertii]|uniref:substrate-binding periplasmic protein n=1 Tax=Aeromonas schubertii TaxID=652 RepID=UPI0038B60611
MSRYRLLLLLSLALLSRPGHGQPLRMVVHDFAPFTFADEAGRAQGALVELVQEACRRRAEGCEILYRPSRRARLMLERGWVDAMFPLGVTPERLQKLDFSTPIASTSYGFYGVADSPLERLTAQSLSGMKVGTFGPSFTQYLLEQINREVVEGTGVGMTIDVQPNADAKGLAKLVYRRYPLYFSNIHCADYHLRRSGLTGVRQLGGLDLKVEYRIGFARERVSTDEVTRFNGILHQLEQEGVASRIRAKWQLAAPDLAAPLAPPGVDKLLRDGRS